MRIIGVTGPTGSGKSFLCERLREHNIPCIDADGVYHSMLVPPSECLDALRLAFGDGIFTPDGHLNRQSLGKIVFTSPEKLDLLNKTVLSRVLCRVRDIIADYEKQGFQVVAVDAPTLIESGFDKECDTVVCVLASESVRRERIIERDSLTDETANLRLKAQKGDEFYRQSSDVIIENDGDPQKFQQDILSLLAKLS